MGISARATDDIEDRRRASLTRIALLALFALLYIAPLDIRPLGSPDEVRYGEIAREMLATGDWVTPRFNGVRYFEKPVLGHWINALSLAAFGENAFALRLPAALATGLTALIIFALTRRFVSRSSALLAATIFLTTILVGGLGTTAILDPFLSLFTTAAVATWYLASHEQSQARRLRYLVACGVACGGAFLVKGFIGWAVPAIVAAAFLISQRRWRGFATLPWVPVVVAMLVAAPWAALIHAQEPDFWRYFFWVEHVQRFASDNAQHARPPWFYFAYLPFVSWPWILSWPAAFVGLRSTVRRDPFLVYVAMWAVLPLIFFSIARGKLLTYVLPCFPAISILLAVGLERYVTHVRQRAARAPMIAIIGVFSLALTSIVTVQAGALVHPIYGEAEGAKVVALCALLAIGLTSSIVAYQNRRPLTRVLAGAIAGMAVILPLQILLPQRVVDELIPTVAITHFAPTHDAVIVSDASLFGAVAWTLKRDDIYVVDPGEIKYGLTYPEDSFRNLTDDMLDELIAKYRAHAEIVIICESETEQAIAPHLPETATRSQYGATVFLRIPKAAM